MNFQLVYRPEAVSDLKVAVDYYEGQAPGLGDRFLNEFLAATRFIRHSAETPRIIFEDFRRVLFKKFPFALWYEVHAKTAIIVLVWDCRKNPDQLEDLLPGR